MGLKKKTIHMDKKKKKKVYFIQRLNMTPIDVIWILMTPKMI